jgi:protein-S-isoprenylcysteine O-methyltransferase Ste14
MSITKLVLVGAGAVGSYLSVRPPNPSPEKGREAKEMPEQDTIRRTVRLGTGFTRFVIVAAVASQTAASLILDHDCFGGALWLLRLAQWCYLPSYARWSWPGDAVAFGALAVGVTLRLWSYRALGRFFTFQLAVHKDHSLVTTGPYRWLRHPSYTAMTLVGPALTWFFMRPLLDDVMVPRYVVPMLARILPAWSEAELATMATQAWWTSLVVVHTAGLRRRIEEEEAMLQAEFGTEWTTFARSRFGLVPGLEWLLRC